MKKSILILQGIPGSGKTTYAIKWVNEDPDNRIRINQDSIREMIAPLDVYWKCSKDSISKKEEMVNQILRATLQFAMNKGLDIVLDNTNLNSKVLNDTLKLIHNVNEILTSEDKYLKRKETITYEVHYLVFDTPLEECIKRDKLRKFPVGEKVITGFYNRYKEDYNL